MRISAPVVLGFLLTLWGIGNGSKPGHTARLATEDKLLTGNVTTRQPAPDKATTNRNVHLNFRNADIRQIITLMSELTGKNFLVDKKVRGKVTVIAPKPVNLEEAYQVFVSILEIRGSPLRKGSNFA